MTLEAPHSELLEFAECLMKATDNVTPRMNRAEASGAYYGERLTDSERQCMASCPEFSWLVERLRRLAPVHYDVNGYLTSRALIDNLCELKQRWRSEAARRDTFITRRWPHASYKYVD